MMGMVIRLGMVVVSIIPMEQWVLMRNFVCNRSCHGSGGRGDQKLMEESRDVTSVSYG